MRSTTYLPHLISIQIRFQHSEFGDEAPTSCRGVPISRDLCRIILTEDRIEDWLIRKARRKSTHVHFLDQMKFSRPHRAPEHYSFLMCHQIERDLLRLLHVESHEAVEIRLFSGNNAL